MSPVCRHAGDVQNDSMKRVAPGTRAAALALSSLLVLTACGGGDGGDAEPDAEETTQTTPAEEETDADGLTEPGTALDLRESAVFEWKPNQKKPGSTVSLTVNRITQGTRKDLRAIVVDPAPKDPKLYYVQVTVENTGDGDLGGFSPISLPLYVNDGSSVLVRPAELLLTFKPCQLRKLPAKFAGGATANRCLVYLLDGRELEDVSLVPDLDEDPIAWEGDVTTPGRRTPKNTTPKQKPSASATS